MQMISFGYGSTTREVARHYGHAKSLELDRVAHQHDRLRRTLPLRLALILLCWTNRVLRSQALPVYRAVDLLDLERQEAHHKGDAVASTTDDPSSDVQERFYTQRLDHFRPTETRTFQQRYFYTDRYVRSTSIHQKLPINRNFSDARDNQTTNRSTQQIRSLYLMCVGGEGPPLDKSVLVDSPHCTGDMLETAKALFLQYSHLSIHLYSLEHRYYGQSFPSFHHNGTRHDMVYLSSRQALNDLASFCSHIRRQDSVHIGFQTTPMWIFFGASYPGVLAAWSRLRFPHIVYASISNSAPVQAVLNFAAYNGHVARDLCDERIGGSKRCLSIFRIAHARLAHTLDPKSIAFHRKRALRILNRLHVCNATAVLNNRRNLQLLIGDGVYNLGTQGNDPSCSEPLCNIAKSCAAIIDRVQSNNNSVMEAIIWASSMQRTSHDDCIMADWDDTVDYLRNVQRSQWWHSWAWQTCTEFGFYQTCEYNSSCPFAMGYHPLSQDLDLCYAGFGMDAETVAASVQESNEYYGGWGLRHTSSRIFSVTGDVDPWTEMALVPNGINDDDMPAWTVPGASHHFWTHPIQASDGHAIQDARLAIQRQVKSWLGLEDATNPS